MTRKQLIIDAAIKLFSEQGIESTSVQQITDLCGISKGAFYLSFKSKDELIYSIIEHFMNTIITAVDQSVITASEPMEKLHIYFTKTFTILSEYSTFGEILMREKLPAMSEQLIEKIHYYILLSNKNLEKLLFSVFGDTIEGKQYDLIIVINGMVQSYLQWIFETKQPVNIELLAQSLVEKTVILAKHSHITFLKDSRAIYEAVEKITLTDILEECIKLISEVHSDIERQSLELLIEELQQSSPRPAMIIGMAKNLETNEKFNWIVFYLTQTFR